MKRALLGLCLTIALLVAACAPNSQETQQVVATEVAKEVAKIEVPSGPPGPQGGVGTMGEQGQQGEKGVPGEQGEQGVQGERGEQGEQGVQGERGEQGEQGVQGERGEQGVQGERGEQGEQGVQGERGEQGEQGVQGERGEQGEQGVQGERGEQGEQGVQGERGEQGEQGVQGERGEQGVQGERGEQGEQGERGEQGVQGAPGPGASADFADLVASVKASVVKIKHPELTTFTMGTGFFVAPSCSVLTARHVVEELDSDRLMSNLIFELQDGQVVQASVSYDLKAKDLVVLRPIRSVNCQELPLSDSSAQLGQLVLLVGFPAISAAEDALFAIPGHVIAMDTGGRSDFLLMAPTHYGISGSPILNTQGEIIGLVGGKWIYETDDDGNYISTYSPISYGFDVVKHLQ